MAVRESDAPARIEEMESARTLVDEKSKRAESWHTHTIELAARPEFKSIFFIGAICATLAQDRRRSRATC